MLGIMYGISRVQRHDAVGQALALSLRGADAIFQLVSAISLLQSVLGIEYAGNHVWNIPWTAS